MSFLGALSVSVTRPSTHPSEGLLPVGLLQDAFIRTGGAQSKSGRAKTRLSDAQTDGGLPFKRRLSARDKRPLHHRNKFARDKSWRLTIRTKGDVAENALRWRGRKRSPSSASIAYRTRSTRAFAYTSQKELVHLTLAIVAINGWNRLAVAFRTVPGTFHLGGRAHDKKDANEAAPAYSAAE